METDHTNKILRTFNLGPSHFAFFSGRLNSFTEKALNGVIKYSTGKGKYTLYYKKLFNYILQHRLLVINREIKRRKRKRAVCRQPRIKRGNLTKDKDQELREWFLAMKAWKSRGNATKMWTKTADFIREVAREILGVMKGYSGVIKGTGGGMGRFKVRWTLRKRLI